MPPVYIYKPKYFFLYHAHSNWAFITCSQKSLDCFWRTPFQNYLFLKSAAFPTSHSKESHSLELKHCPFRNPQQCANTPNTINIKNQEAKSYQQPNNFRTEQQISAVVVQSLRRVQLLWPHGLQHARLPCLSPSPRACSNSCPLSQWCHPTISSPVTPSLIGSCLNWQMVLRASVKPMIQGILSLPPV